MKIYLLRHCQQDDLSHYNPHANLSIRGVEQAHLLGRRLQKMNIVHLYSSPLPRAMQTTNTLQQYLKKEPVILPDLREINFGALEGLSFSEVEEQYAEFKQVFSLHLDDLAYPGGECGADVQKRAFHALEKVVQAEKDAAVVTHSAVLLVILCSILGLGMEKRFNFCQLDHGSISVINYFAPNDYKIQCINDTAHLE